MKNFTSFLFIILAIASVFLSPALALFAGILLALTLGNPYSAFSKKCSKYLLQISVVGLGFGMNLHESLQSGKDGMIFTVISVIGVILLGFLIGKLMKIPANERFLISSGTAICGGSAIAAVGPVINADDDDMSISLATIFILNAIALFIFPAIGRAFELSDRQFGTWAAIAIHDTSSVVGAGEAYSPEALKVATTVKLTRALWIIPLSIFSIFVFKTQNRKINIPWFIFLFILAMIANTYISLPEWLTSGIVFGSKKALSVTLFFIGCGLTLKTIRTVGAKPLIFGILLWFIISISSLIVILYL